jgi:hypothetical protein
MEGFLEGGTRNASTRVAGKVGWPVNWWPTLVLPNVATLGAMFALARIYEAYTPQVPDYNLVHHPGV